MKIQGLFILSTLVVIMLSSCSQKNYSPTPGWNYSESPLEQQFVDMDKSEGESDLYTHEQNKSKETKIIYSAYLSLSVDKPDTANTRIEEFAKKHKGYVTSLGNTRTVIRIPSKNLDAAIKDVSTLGKVLSKSKNGEDVTKKYRDYKIRLDNAEKSRKRYLELLNKAQNVKEAILVEKELERLNGTIDMLKGNLNNIDHLDKYSTLTVNIQECKKPGIIGYIGIGLYYGVRWLFVRN